MKTQNNKGFTIIEVVLVLAIAALIFLVVFLAVPALQSGQRDTQRRSDLSRLQTSIENYRSNNKGTLPTFNTAFMDSYLRTAGESFVSPSGDNYVFAAWPAPSTTANTIPAFDNRTQASGGNSNVIYYVTARKCGTGEGTVTSTAGTRDFAIAMPQEGGGVACQNN